MSEAETMTKKLIQTPHIVAHIDFLGASKKMLTPGESNDFLQKINCIYKLKLKIKWRYQERNLIIQIILYRTHGTYNLPVVAFSKEVQ